MNKFFFALLSCCCFTATQAQINELGVFVGGSNFIGDVGSTQYINPNSPALGLIYKWNKTPRHSWRFSYTQAKLIGNDKNSDDKQRNSRQLDFQNNIKELSGGIEFNFFDFDLHKKLDKKVSPYFFTGLSLFLYELKKYKGDQLPPLPVVIIDKTAEPEATKKSISIPLIIGVKSNLTTNFVVGLEIGLRYSIIDDLDGYLEITDRTPPPTPPPPVFVPIISSNNIGNITNKDWYVFSGITLSYMFGTKPCFCAE